MVCNICGSGFLTAIVIWDWSVIKGVAFSGPVPSYNYGSDFPNVIENGWVYHRLIVFKHKDLEELLRRFDNWGWVSKILRKVPFDGFIASSLTISADTLFSGLTERQLDAVLTAHQHGYYNLPRDADVQVIAAKKKVPRTTFQEHLKKAENKLVASLVPHMKLFSHASPARRRSLRAK